MDGPTLDLFLHRFYFSHASDTSALGTEKKRPHHLHKGQDADLDAYGFGGLLHFFESLQQCRIVLLDNDHIGIAPDLACNGDIVCVFQDADSPCILRQGQDEKWTLISGNCAVFDDRLGLCTVHFSSEFYLEDYGNNLETFIIC